MAGAMVVYSIHQIKDCIYQDVLKLVLNIPYIDFNITIPTLGYVPLRSGAYCPVYISISVSCTKAAELDMNVASVIESSQNNPSVTEANPSTVQEVQEVPVQGNDNVSSSVQVDGIRAPTTSTSVEEPPKSE